MAETSGGEVLARILQAEGVEKVFGIIDGTYFGFYSALHRLGIEIVTPRHETSAAHMAGVWISWQHGQLDHRLTWSYHPYMETTKLSSKGQVVLPKSVREAHGWGPGTEFIVEATPDGVRLRAKAPFPRTDLDAIFGSVQHQGRAKSVEEMDAGIRRAVRNRYRRAVKR